jgi:hypothetical protein
VAKTFAANGFSTSAIQALLEPDEEVLWSGCPQQGLMLRPSDGCMIPFSLFWCGFAIFCETSVIKQGAPAFFDVWGIPFVLVGLYMVFGRFVYDAFQRTRTYYPVTNQRVMIVTHLFSNNIRTLALEGLTDINLSMKANGRGTLRFGRDSNPYGGLTFRGLPGGSTTAPAFEGIDDAADVLRLIRDAQKAQ